MSAQIEDTALSFFKNKHVILAMFVAPILSIIAYFSVDYVVSEKPHKAQKGNNYRLIANSNCRYQSGQCTLQNGEVEINIRAKRVSAEQIELHLDSELPIQNAMISYVEDSIESAPVAIYTRQSQGRILKTQLSMVSPQNSHIRLALKIYESTYYAETPAIFVDYQTAFSQQNFSK